MTLWWSLASVPPGASLFVGVDKLEHGLAYFVTSLLFLLAAVWRPGRGGGGLAGGGGWGAGALGAAGGVGGGLQALVGGGAGVGEWVVGGGAVAAGGLVEVLQSLIGRDAEVRDWLAEIVAVALAWGVVRAWSALRPSG